MFAEIHSSVPITLFNDFIVATKDFKFDLFHYFERFEVNFKWISGHGELIELELEP